jgi:ribosomal protein S18 acetylase RimI-like enzyme
MVGREPLRLVRASLRDRDARLLVDEVQAEYVVRYGAPDETPLDESVFDPPGGAFFLGYAGEVAVAMGGWKTRPDVHPWGTTRVAELKRMYVAPAARRRGYARQVLRRLEETARQAGVQAIVLETGTAQPEAIAMYTADGFELIDDFGYYAWSPQVRSFAKRL